GPAPAPEATGAAPRGRLPASLVAAATPAAATSASPTPAVHARSVIVATTSTADPCASTPAPSRWTHSQRPATAATAALVAVPSAHQALSDQPPATPARRAPYQ